MKQTKAGYGVRTRIIITALEELDKMAGADLNRNYPFMWAGGSSQCYSTYPGPSAGSEPETDAITDYARSIFPDQKGSNPSDPVDEITATGMFIDLHSYSELVLWPWGYTYNNAPNHASLRAMSYKFAYYNGYSPEKSSGLYLTRGSTDDWAYGELGVPGFCIEVGIASIRIATHSKAKLIRITSKLCCGRSRSLAVPIV